MLASLVDDLGSLGPSRLFGAARLLLHGQVLFGMVGCLTMVYGTIHPGQVACALFGLVALDLRSGPLMRSYATLVVYLLVLDVVWHHFWAERLLRNYTGVREENEMWWGLMVANQQGVRLRHGAVRGAAAPVLAPGVVPPLERRLPRGRLRRAGARVRDGQSAQRDRRGGRLLTT